MDRDGIAGARHATGMAGSIAVWSAMSGGGGGEERAGPPRAAKKQNVPFSSSPTSDLYDDPNFDHLVSRQVKVGAGPLGYLFQEYEEAFAPERHARCRRGQGTDSTQEVRGIAEGNREAGRS